MNHWCLSILFSLVIAFGAMAQGTESSAELKKKQAQLRKDIEYKNKLLGQIEEDRKNSSSRVKIISEKINQREQLILSIREEIVLIDEEIDSNEDLIDALEKDIVQLKEEYAKMVQQAYKTRNASNTVMYIFASDDFTQAYRRMKYLQQLSDYRKQQAKAIEYTQESLERKKQQLEDQRQEKNAVLNDQNQEKLTLNRERHEKEQKLKKLGSQEEISRKELLVATKKDEELKQAISRAIKREIEMLAEKNKSKTSNATVFKKAPEDIVLEENFVANKGKLPWPVDQGQVVAEFGQQAHPFLRGVIINKNGITFSTTENNKVRAVFDGVVSKIIILPGQGKLVMIRHGDYITVYTNLRETFVRDGDVVKTKEEIGIILTDKGKTETEFQLWKGIEISDPTRWLYKVK
jgi:septal ring factor EnvC (AmiA/AmiB activator)